MLDSGAYSAWRQGTEIALRSYCRFIAGNRDWIGSHVNLDRINPHAPDKAAYESWCNFRDMRDRDLDPIPVFHAGESEHWLTRYLDLGCRYIGISASSMPHRGYRADRWYAGIFDFFDGLDVRVHVFGEARERVLAPFPFFSSDSTGWIRRAQNMGRVVLAPILTAGNAADQLLKLGITLASLSDPRSQYVVRSYLSCLRELDIERRVQEAHGTEFRYHLGLGNAAARAAFAYAGGGNALVSFADVNKPEHADELRAFVTDPKAACQKDARLRKEWDALAESVC